MKYILVVIIGISISISAFSQNGIYISNRFEFVSKKEPFRNRVDFTPKKLIINITEIHDEFQNGNILWDISDGTGSAEYMKYELLRLKNSTFDQNSNSFIKCYASNMKLLDRIIDNPDIYIIKNVSTGKVRIDVYDPKKQTINRFDQLTKF